MTAQPFAVSVFGRSVVGTTRAVDEDSFVISDLNGAPSPLSTSSADSLPVRERGVLVAVSDGMGGAQAGEVASSLVLSALRHGMSTVQAGGADSALRTSVENANQRVFAAAQAADRVGMGATLTAVLFHGEHAYIAEVGDSRAYLVRAGRIVQLTHDQSYVQTLIDSGALTRKEAEKSELRNVILQAMGRTGDIEVALNRVSVRRHDRFLICSDGLSGVLKSDEMLNGVLKGPTLEAACATLVAAAVARGSEDDITVVLAEVGGESARDMTAAERRSLEGAAARDPTESADVGARLGDRAAAARAPTVREGRGLQASSK